MFLYIVPAVHKSMPERSKPDCVSVLGTQPTPVADTQLGTPGVGSTGCFVAPSRCQFGVTRNVTGM